MINHAVPSIDLTENWLSQASVAQARLIESWPHHEKEKHWVLRVQDNEGHTGFVCAAFNHEPPANGVGLRFTLGDDCDVRMRSGHASDVAHFKARTASVFAILQN